MNNIFWKQYSKLKKNQDKNFSDNNLYQEILLL